MRSVDVRDLVGGLAVAAVGAAFALRAQSFPAGPPGQVGPAYVPTAVGLIAMGLGLVIAARGLMGAHPLPQVSPRPALAIFATVMVFAMLIRPAGLVPTLIASIAVASSGSSNSRPLLVAVLSTSVATACWLVFVVALGLPIPAFGTWF